MIILIIHTEKVIFDNEEVDCFAIVDKYMQFVLYEDMVLCFKFPTAKDAEDALHNIEDRDDYECTYTLLPKAVLIPEEEFNEYIKSISDVAQVQLMEE